MSSLIGQNPATPTTQATTARPLDGKFDAGAGEYVHRAVWKAGVMATLNVLFVILAVRAILLVSVIGSIWLAINVERDPDPWRLGAMGIYTVIVVIPLTWLAARK